VDAKLEDHVAINFGCMIQLHTSPRGLVPMSNDGKPFRKWQEIALEAWRERNPERLRKLPKELEAALDERDKKLNPQPVPPKRQQSA
jgi:hypothetical protein